MALNVGAGSSGSYSAYGLKVKENQQLYDQYLGAYKDVLSGISSVGGAQRQALTDFYAQKQGQADQSLVTRGLSNTTVQDAVNRGLTLDQAKAQTDLADRIATTRANFGSQFAQGLHNFMGGYSESAAHGQMPMMGGGASNGALNFGGAYGRTPLGGGGGVSIGGFMANTGGPIGGPQSVSVPGGMGGDFAGLQGDFGQPFTPSGAVGEGGGYDGFGVPGGMPQGYDDSSYSWA